MHIFMNKEFLIFITIILLVSISFWIIRELINQKKSIRIPKKSKIFLYFASFAFIIAGGFILSDILIFDSQSKNRLLQKSEDKLEYKKNTSYDYFNRSSSILNSIKTSLIFNEYLDKKNIQEKEINDLFLSFASSDKNIMQLRYIDSLGKEVLRVDKKNIYDKPFLIDKKDLQDKSNRYYFTESKNKKYLWYSKIDLNIENEKIEFPYNPTYRVMQPLWKDKKFDGLLVINYFASEILDSILDDTLFEITILDEDGFVLSSSNKINSWERYENKTPKNSFFKYINEIKKDKKLIVDNYAMYSFSLPSNNMFLIFKLKQKYLEDEFKERFFEYILISSIVFLLSIVFIILIGRIFNNLILKLRREKERTERAYEKALSVQKKMRNVQEELIQANNVKNEFLANTSHEIRTPLTGIIGITDILLDDKLTQQQKKYLQTIKNSSITLDNIINDILDLSKIQAGKLEIINKEFSLKNMISNIEYLYKAQIQKKGINFYINIDENLDEVFFGDELRINQILTNLLGNSIKFTHKGVIILNIKKLDEVDNISEIQFEVIDSGIGIPFKTQDKLFESFVQGEHSDKKNYQGTGLGLTISKYLVELMNGKISFESAEDVGTKFYLTLKLETRKNNTKLVYHEENINQLDNYILTKSKKALVVEDSDVNQIVIKNILNKIGFDVILANDGKEALKLVNNIFFDIIFMDIQMPNMDGYEATQIIRTINKNIPIIAISAAVMKEDKIKSLECGMNDYLKKPINKIELTKVLKSYFDLQISNNEISKENDEIIIDGSSLNILLEEFGFDKKTIFNLLVKFRNNYSDSNDIFKENTSTEELKAFAHKLKGASGSLRLTNIHELSKKIVSDDYNKDDIKSLKYRLENVCEEIKRKIVPFSKNKSEILSSNEFKKLLENLKEDLSNYKFIEQNRVEQIVENLIARKIDIETINRVEELFSKMENKKLLVEINKINMNESL